MSMRTRVLGMVDVFMRVPPLFVIDEILKISMGLPSMSSTSSASSRSTVDSSSGSTKGGGLLDMEESMLEIFVNGAFEAINETLNASMGAAAVEGGDTAAAAGLVTEDYFKVLSLTTLKFFTCLVGWMCAACVFMLWTRHLVIVYMYILSIGLIFLSYWSNVSATRLMATAPSILEDILSINMPSLLDPTGVAVAVLPHLIFQWIIGLLFMYTHLGPRYAVVQKMLPLNFVAPILLAMLPLPQPIFRHSPAFSAVMPLALCTVAMWSSSFDVAKTVINGYQHARSFATNFGLSALVENEWQRLNVPCVLRAFWIIRIAEQLLTSVAYAEETIPMLSAAQNLLVGGCETLTAILGMTSIVSVICHYIGKMFQLFLLSEDYDEDKSIGTVSAILFYILALQTGLTTLSPDKRFVRLCRNLCLLVSALLHFLHNIVAPILMSLSAARNPSMKRHARALIVCAFLLAAPMALLTILWTKHSPSTWLLAVTAFSVEVIVKVLVSLATYTLFLLDARRQTFWEKLDDYVYYIRAFGNSVEFCFGIFLFFNGAWILLFESVNNALGGAIRATMMGVHAYFNIWCEARAGWAVFMKRRTAVHKISALPEATEQQLAVFDDVCAICYQKMTSAKITRCRHYFHGVCLRKWLYVQDRCPLCHEIIMHQEPTASEKLQQPGQAAGEQQPMNHAEAQAAPIVANGAAAGLVEPVAGGANEVAERLAQHLPNIQARRSVHQTPPPLAGGSSQQPQQQPNEDERRWTSNASSESDNRFDDLE